LGQQTTSRRQLPNGNLYAGEKFGGYFIYKLFPRVKVFADGRSDLYNGGRVLEDVRKLAALKSDWSDVLDRNQVDWMVLEREEPLAVVIEMTGQWDKVYEDGTARILVRKTARIKQGRDLKVTEPSVLRGFRGFLWVPFSYLVVVPRVSRRLIAAAPGRR
jgi:hypothetical protein